SGPIIYFKQLHTPTNSLILSLAVADLFVGVIVFPLSIEFSATSCLYNENLFCIVRSYFDITLCTASILNLCCISIDRYYAVCQPLTYNTKINAQDLIMILVSWSVSILIAIGFIIAGLNHEKCEEGCFIQVPFANIVGPFFSFYLPVIIMLCIYLSSRAALSSVSPNLSSMSTVRHSSETVLSTSSFRLVSSLTRAFLLSFATSACSCLNLHSSANITEFCFPPTGSLSGVAPLAESVTLIFALSFLLDLVSIFFLLLTFVVKLIWFWPAFCC
ncbi:trace amine-associated receptor 1-like, partial [Trachinotus anak]|uniref:trace amine-associated receptor 1-like n=1 Tax=Trachinotus anak TaxID=443729 RepID=UPI0039F1FE86